MQVEPTVPFEVKGSGNELSVVVLQSIMAIPLGLALIIALTESFRHDQASFWNSAWPVTVGLLLFEVGMHLWAKSVVIRADDDTLSYHSLFGTKSFRFSDIKNLTFKCYEESYADRFRPMNRIIVKLKPGGSRITYLNIRPIKREGLARLRAVLRAKLGDKNVKG